MTKSDLKTGMIIETRGGKLGMVMLGLEQPKNSNLELDVQDGRIVGGSVNVSNPHIHQNTFTWGPISNWNEDLTSNMEVKEIYGENVYDIVRVYDVDFAAYAASFDVNSRTVLWERSANDTIKEKYKKETGKNWKMELSPLPTVEYTKWLEEQLSKK